MDALVQKIDGANVGEAAQALAQLKLALLDPRVAQQFGRAGLEAGARLALRQRDNVALERALTQLMPYYAAPAPKACAFCALPMG